jgi:NAD(P)-dependent dehydrogenase (short-subunit alcohol dehydrogenase family)
LSGGVPQGKEELIMGIYAITGGSGGIGGKCVEYLQSRGHSTINIDIKNCDVVADLTTPAGRKAVVDELHQLAPNGLDGLICCAGVGGECPNLATIVSLNYFGTRVIAEGCLDLMEMRHGYCVIISSHTISEGAARQDVVDLLNNQEDEQRVLNLVKTFDKMPGNPSNAMYAATKVAITRWMRRVSPDWGARGVHLNAVAPGNVRTPMTECLSEQNKEYVKALPIPILYGSEEFLMSPADVANAIVFLASPMAHGINGQCLFVDGGTDALLNSEKVY